MNIKNTESLDKKKMFLLYLYPTTKHQVNRTWCNKYNNEWDERNLSPQTASPTWRLPPDVEVCLRASLSGAEKASWML